MRVLLDENVDRLLKLGVVVLRATSNAYSAVAPHIPELNDALRAIKPGEVVHVPA